MAESTRVPIGEALRAYEAGATAAKCAKLAGVSRTTFRKRVVEAGLPLRHQAADPAALDAAIAAYVDGRPIETCAVMCAIGHETFRQHLMRRGVPIRDRASGRRTPTPDGLIADYVAGMSVLATAAKYGLQRSTVNRMLKDAGIDARDQSAATRLRWERASDAERHAMVDRAHEATRGRPLSEAQKGRMAAARAGQPRSPYETEMGDLLADLGHEVVYGVPCGRYNLDIVIGGTVAVEIFGGHWHENGYHRERFPGRARHVLDSGYSLAIVWVDRRRYPVSALCAQHLGTLAQLTSGNPAIGRHHWVLRGDGYFLAAREDDGGPVPFVAVGSRRHTS